MSSVRLVDEGGKAVVGVDQLRFLPEQFRCLPCQVKIVILIVAMRSFYGQVISYFSFFAGTDSSSGLHSSSPWWVEPGG